MRLNERQRRWLIENDLLLEMAGDGGIEAIWAATKAPLKEFGDVFKASIGLVMTDITYLLKLTWGSVFIKGPDFRQKLQDEKNRKRDAFLQRVQKGWNMENVDNDQKFMMCMLNPMAVFGGLGIGVATKPFDPEWRSNAGKMGFDLLPWPMGGKNGFFSEDFEWESPDLWKQMASAPNDEAAMKIFDTKMDALLNRKGGGDGDGEYDKDIAGIPKSALWLTGLFMLATEDDDHYGDLLVEADKDDEDKDVDSEEEIEPPYEIIRKWLAQQAQEHLEIPTDELIEMKEESLKAYIGDIPAAVDAVCSLTGTNSADEFFAGFESLQKIIGDKAKNFSIDKVKESFAKAKEQLKEDEESMQKLKKQFEEKKEEPTEEKVNNQLDMIVLSGFKGQFLPDVKAGLEDMIEDTHSEIWDGLTKEQLKLASETEQGKAYIKLCKEYEGKINKGLSKLKQA